MPVAVDTVRVVPTGFSASKMPAQRLLWLIVAVPVPVEPAVAFKFHAPATVPLPVGNGELAPYNSLRAPGDVVENEVIVWFSSVAANIRTAALAEAVVIAVAEIVVPAVVLKL